MLRYRFLEADEVQLKLFSRFDPSSDSDDLSEEPCAMYVKFDLARRSMSDQTPFLEVLPHCPYPLPPLKLIMEEVTFMSNLLKQLQNYETSSSSQSPDFQEI